MDLNTKEGRRRQGERILRAAEAAGVSVEDLAQQIGVSRALIYQYTSGFTLAQPHRLQEIARILGVSLAFFYLEEGDLPEKQQEKEAALDAERQAIAAERAALDVERTQLRLRRLQETFDHHRDLAQALEAPPDPRRLVSVCERMVALARELDNEEAEAEAYRRMGNAHLQLAEYDRAIAALEQAITLYRSLGSARWELSARQSLGAALLAQGRPEPALEHFRKVAEGEDWWNRWQGALSVGAVCEHRGDYRGAMEAFDRALEIVESGDDHASVAEGRVYVQSNIANVSLACGDYREALSLSEAWGADAERLGLRDQYLEAHLNAAVCLMALGRYPAGRVRLERMLESARFLGDRGRAAAAEAWQCALLTELGRFDEARRHGKNALQTALQLGCRRAEIFAHLHLADAYIRGGAPGEGLYHAEQGVQTARDLRAVGLEAPFRERTAAALLAEGDAARAEAEARDALDRARKLGLQHTTVNAAVTLARALLALERPSEAADQAEAALQDARRIGTPEPAWRAHHLLARASMAAGERQTALGHARQAVELIEELRQPLRHEDEEDSLLEDEERLQVYLDLALLLRRSGDEVGAEAAVERAGWPPLAERFAATIEGEL